ncbi:hypothetical protein [Varibaculum cambriense]|nr:hypothetical protein [Varibaculum cambriense]
MKAICHIPGQVRVQLLTDSQSGDLGNGLQLVTRYLSGGTALDK